MAQDCLGLNNSANRLFYIVRISSNQILLFLNAVVLWCERSPFIHDLTA